MVTIGLVQFGAKLTYCWTFLFHSQLLDINKCYDQRQKRKQVKQVCQPQENCKFRTVCSLNFSSKARQRFLKPGASVKLLPLIGLIKIEQINKCHFLSGSHGQNSWEKEVFENYWINLFSVK